MDQHLEKNHSKPKTNIFLISALILWFGNLSLLSIAVLFLFFSLLCTFSGRKISLDILRPLAEQEPATQTRPGGESELNFTFRRNHLYLLSSKPSRYNNFFSRYKNSPQSVLHLTLWPVMDVCAHALSRNKCDSSISDGIRSKNCGPDSFSKVKQKFPGDQTIPISAIYSPKNLYTTVCIIHNGQKGVAAQTSVNW